MEKVNLISTTVGFIGGGNMASAVGAGLIRKGKRVFVLNRSNVNEIIITVE